MTRGKLPQDAVRVWYRHRRSGRTPIYGITLNRGVTIRLGPTSGFDVAINVAKRQIRITLGKTFIPTQRDRRRMITEAVSKDFRQLPRGRYTLVDTDVYEYSDNKGAYKSVDTEV